MSYELKLACSRLLRRQNLFFLIWFYKTTCRWLVKIWHKLAKFFKLVRGLGQVYKVVRLSFSVSVRVILTLTLTLKILLLLLIINNFLFCELTLALANHAAKRRLTSKTIKALVLHLISWLYNNQYDTVACSCDYV